MNFVCFLLKDDMSDIISVWLQEGQEKLLHVQGQEGAHKEIALLQGKKQWLHFAGAAVKRYPTSKVRETQVTG